jgi:hypothetical protein
MESRLCFARAAYPDAPAFGSGSINPSSGPIDPGQARVFDAKIDVPGVVIDNLSKMPTPT